MSILSPSNEILAEVDLTMTAPFTNHDNTGVYNRGTDAADFLTMETLSTVHDGVIDMTFRFHRGDPTGHYPDKIEQSLALVNAFAAPNRMRIARMRGSSADVREIPTGPRDTPGARWNVLLLRYVRAMITIQRYVDVELKNPDLATEDFQHIEEVLRAARLIDGEVIDVSWAGIKFTLHPDTPPPEGLQQAVFPQELSVVIGGDVIRLGAMLVTTGAVDVVNVETDDAGTTTAELVPALGSNTVQLRLGVASIEQDPPN